MKSPKGYQPVTVVTTAQQAFLTLMLCARCGAAVRNATLHVSGLGRRKGERATGRVAS